MTERAQLAKAQAVAVELHALMTLDPKNLGLQTLLERKGALLERQTRVQTAFRRDANAQVEQPGAIGRMFEGPDGAHAARVGRTSSARRTRTCCASTRRWCRSAPSLPRTPANAARIADLDTRIQVMQQRMQMHDMQRRRTRDTRASQPTKAARLDARRAATTRKVHASS